MDWIGISSFILFSEDILLRALHPPVSVNICSLGLAHSCHTDFSLHYFAMLDLLYLEFHLISIYLGFSGMSF